MAKVKDKVPSPSQAKDKELKETKDKVVKGKSNLVGRVKKVIKKSRRKLGEEKFEKELQRTIEFLGKLQTKLDATHSARENGKPPAKTEKKPAPRASSKVEKKGARNTPKNSQPNKKNVKKPADASKKRKALLVEDATAPAEPAAARQIEALSKGR
jgi:hypothetical protein